MSVEDNMTEQAYKLLADEFQEQFNNKQEQLNKCKEQLLMTSKGVMVAYSVFRLLDNYLTRIETDKEDDVLEWIKSTIEMGREELSNVVEELVE